MRGVGICNGGVDTCETAFAWPRVQDIARSGAVILAVHWLASPSAPTSASRGFRQGAGRGPGRFCLRGNPMNAFLQLLQYGLLWLACRNQSAPHTSHTFNSRLRYSTCGLRCNLAWQRIQPLRRPFPPLRYRTFPITFLEQHVRRGPRQPTQQCLPRGNGPLVESSPRWMPVNHLVIYYFLR